MTNEQILRHIDHTLLTATATWAEVQAVCDEAVRYHTASVCVPPSYVARIREQYPGEPVICTVIGFPLGYHATAAKIAEAEIAIRDGADEIDVVVNLGDVKEGNFEAVTAEIKALRAAAGPRVILKIIVEACYLTRSEKVALCHCVTDGGADYIKTSTGFGAGGATMEDVLLFRAHIGPVVRIKASGGIRSREDMVSFLEAGCDRIGASAAVKLLAPAGL